MNPSVLATMAYKQNAREVRSDRANEYEALSQVTNRLKRATSAANIAYSELVAAMHDNRRLWSVLALDVADEGNRLPQELKAKLVYLYEFISTHTARVLRQEAEVGPLIDINLAVMRGLMPQKVAA